MSKKLTLKSLQDNYNARNLFEVIKGCKALLKKETNNLECEILLASELLIGMGLPLLPKKPLNLGVFFIICQVSSFKFIFIRMYPGKIFLSELTLTPLFTSTML